MNWTTSYRHLFLVVLLALVPEDTHNQGLQIVLGKAEDQVELPCRGSSGSQKKTAYFSWKDDSNTLILRNQNDFITKGSSKLKDRVDSKKTTWSQGYYPLIISKLKQEDTGIYICEVGDQKTKVQLLVFRLTHRPSDRVIVGQSLSVTLEDPPGSSVEKLSVEWKVPGAEGPTKGRDFSLSQVELRNSGPWKCNISVGQTSLVLSINILVLGFRTFLDPVYAREGDKVEFLFPLNFEAKSLNGDLQWQAEGASSPQLWVNFTLENNQLTVNKAFQHLEMQEAHPFCLTLRRVLLQYGGSGTLTLNLKEGVLHRTVNLVVMRVTTFQNNVTCEVRGPLPPTPQLVLKRGNQSVEEISKVPKQVTVLNAEAGTWQCLLRHKNKVLLTTEVEVSPQFTKASPTFLAIVLGGIAGLLLLSGFCIVCCVKCWHRKRQAERMSQIKRLLSEKKTCQCHHRQNQACPAWRVRSGV
ncbi:T-cell surface glycoprotein CD4 isoform X2 [Talpa occidentalis]|uniref:T-cell surface glycoprotein CD4 isoform X2 n=1 Tax=Talpa occidentalis TaxID=50954 RepID=UPI0023F87A1B|nr:T-cell surface glycoprotein CD4 isoform X2 [Talpa occidentalis]